MATCIKRLKKYLSKLEEEKPYSARDVKQRNSTYRDELDVLSAPRISSDAKRKDQSSTDADGISPVYTDDKVVFLWELLTIRNDSCQLH